MDGQRESRKREPARHADEARKEKKDEHLKL